MTSAAGSAQPNRLEARKVGVRFEGLVALDKIDLALAKGDILGLIGPNGAGKTTLLNVLSGFQAPDTGGVFLGADDITRWPAHKYALAGIGRTFQAVRLFGSMTTSENVEMACVGIGLDRENARARAAELLDLLGVQARSAVRADSLPYGQERLVGIARALALQPAFLLLDEPAAGLTPGEARELLERISTLRERYGCGILIVDHNMSLIMELCERVQVLSEGRTIAQGSAEDVRSNEDVRRAYLGSFTSAPATLVTRRVSVEEPEPLLEVADLSVEYGAVRAVAGVDIAVFEKQTVAIIGPNGAGKSSLMNCIAGLVRQRQGTVAYRNAIIDPWPADRRVHAGIALVPEGRRVFAALTVGENLRAGLIGRQANEQVEPVLDRFPVLRRLWGTAAGKLSGGEQQQLAIARALLTQPSLLLLDEPSLGLAPLMVDTVYDVLDDLREGGMSILLVEQNAAKAISIADRLYVMRNGQVELSGPTEDVVADPSFERAYFGF